jgi:hypothetical protein
MFRSYGYVYKPGTPEQYIFKGIDRPFRVDETISFAIQYNGWNPKDVWVFDSKYGITETYFSPENPPTTEELAKMKEISKDWNHKYIHGFEGSSPEYSLISCVYVHHGEEIRSYCMCVDDYKSKWYVKCVSFPETEVREYWKNSGMGYEAARFAFFDEKCPYHKKHGHPYQYSHIPNAFKAM